MDDVLAIVIAFGASFCVNYSTFMQKKAVDALPTLELRLSWGVLKTFFTNKPWIAAMAVDALGTALFMVALIFLPVSIVEPIITAGIALLAYLAIKNLGERPTRLDYTAIAVTVTGVVLLGVSLAEGLPKGKSYHEVEVWVVAAVIVTLAAAIPGVMRLTGKGSVAAGLGIAGGLVIGLAGVFSRLLMGNFGGRWYLWLPVCALTYPAGFMLFQSGLQRGKAVVVAPLHNALTMCVPVVVGIIALDETFPDNPALAALRIVAFAAIAAGTVVLSRRTPEAMPSRQ